jgi:hypothetical protein
MKKYSELKALGFQFSGKTFKSWENKEANAYAKRLRTNGTQAYAVQKIERTNFRDRTSTDRYLWIMILLSPEAQAAKHQEYLDLQAARRQAELISLTKTLTLEELAFMLSHKSTIITQEK